MVSMLQQLNGTVKVSSSVPSFTSSMQPPHRHLPSLSMLVLSSRFLPAAVQHLVQVCGPAPYRVQLPAVPLPACGPRADRLGHQNPHVVQQLHLRPGPRHGLCWQLALLGAGLRREEGYQAQAPQEAAQEQHPLGQDQGVWAAGRVQWRADAPQPAFVAVPNQATRLAVPAGRHVGSPGCAQRPSTEVPSSHAWLQVVSVTRVKQRLISSWQRINAGTHTLKAAHVHALLTTTHVVALALADRGHWPCQLLRGCATQRAEGCCSIRSRSGSRRLRHEEEKLIGCSSTCPFLYRWHPEWLGVDCTWAAALLSTLVSAGLAPIVIWELDARVPQPCCLCNMILLC